MDIASPRLSGYSPSFLAPYATELDIKPFNLAILLGIRDAHDHGLGTSLEHIRISLHRHSFLKVSDVHSHIFRSSCYREKAHYAYPDLPRLNMSISIGANPLR